MRPELSCIEGHQDVSTVVSPEAVAAIQQDIPRLGLQWFCTSMAQALDNPSYSSKAEPHCAVKSSGERRAKAQKCGCWKQADMQSCLNAHLVNGDRQLSIQALSAIAAPGIKFAHSAKPSQSS